MKKLNVKLVLVGHLRNTLDLKIGIGTLKALFLGLLFFACFALTIPVVVLTSKMFPSAPFILKLLPIIPLMALANRFVLSPVEFHLNIKSMQYDPWYERRRKKRETV